MRYKKNQRVEFRENGKKGTVVDVIVKTSEEEGKKKCEVLYLVKPDGASDFDEYMVCTRKDLRPEQKEIIVKDDSVYVTEETEEGFKVLMYAETFDGPVLFCKDYPQGDGRCSCAAYVDELKKQLYVSYAICSPDDEFDLNRGLKIARHRLFEQPYFKMYAERESEFDKETVEAILKAKAKYIVAHKERFVNKRGEHFDFKK
jgi:hypothetical protein